MSGPERHTEPDRGFGRDGISGLVDANRALRARDVSRPGSEELEGRRPCRGRCTGAAGSSPPLTGTTGGMLSRIVTP